MYFETFARVLSNAKKLTIHAFSELVESVPLTGISSEKLREQ